MLPAALWRPGLLALCLYMFRGVILRPAGLLGCPRWLSCEVQIRALVQIFLAMGKHLPSVVLGPWAGGIGRSSDRPLTVGVDVAGRHAAPEARLEWQTRRGRALPHAGHGPVPTTTRLQAQWPERSQTPQAGARARSALSGGLREVLAGQ